MDIDEVTMKNDCVEQRIDEAASIDAPILPDNQKHDDNVTTYTPKEIIRKVISNSYLNVVERLQIKYPSRCARDINYCHSHHFSALLPNAPNFSQATSLRSTLMNNLYLNFIETVEMMCTSSIFPGDGVLTKIIEIILGLSPKKLDALQFQMIYVETIQLFRLIICAFPPCWLALRPYYVTLLDTPIVNKQVKGKKNLKLDSEQKKIVPLLLKMLETCITECNKDELSLQTNLYAIAEEPSVDEDCNKSNEDDELPEMTTTELMNPYDWGDNQISLENFYKMSTSDRIARIFDVLELFLCLIESDCCMWLLHHTKKIRDKVFAYEKCPLIVIVCVLTEQQRNTEVVRQLFKLFAIASAKGLHKERLIIIERYISLIFEISNSADLEFYSSGVNYPSLSKGTKNLIHEFFHTFKAHNPSHISSYVQAMKLISQPYVRYQFIDHFLQMFHFPKTEKLTPKKIANDIIHRKTWRKYKPRAVVSSSDIDDISREDYLDLLLNALRAYCMWHGCHLVLHSIEHKRDIKPLQTDSQSPHLKCQIGGHHFKLQRIENELDIINRDLNVDVLLSIPKVDLPLIDIKVDSEVINQYNVDKSYIEFLAIYLPKEAAMHPQVDFSDWLEFLKEFPS